MKPIIFSTPMVQAILDGRKTQTRRVIMPQPDHVYDYYTGSWECDTCGHCHLCEPKPPYQPGDILWVRETVWQRLHSTLRETREYSDEEWFYWGSEFRYAATDKEPKEGNWVKRPSIHMPREVARIFLRVTNVRVERLQDISNGDCWAEGLAENNPDFNEAEHHQIAGVNIAEGSCERHAFACLWNGLYAKRGCGWDTNPWVWVIDFERITKVEALKIDKVG